LEDLRENEFLLDSGSQFVIHNIYRVDQHSYKDDRFENITVFEVSMVANENKVDVIGKAKPWWERLWDNRFDI
jgi:hypothetical protein